MFKNYFSWNVGINKIMKIFKPLLTFGIAVLFISIERHPYRIFHSVFACILTDKLMQTCFMPSYMHSGHKLSY